ncbi:pectinesterase family protein [Roseateles sp. SL47]|uniref:pectinesterase family protein n=1 Tax=Roseateles sp. SL47 TaxID=2995138 RepID=UPI00227124C6|nr:pectinesterase family protein [Roseateles sp. SL47]WAC71500.1 pectinesterase family protein [Roseateles sp. SL47]
MRRVLAGAALVVGATAGSVTVFAQTGARPQLSEADAAALTLERYLGDWSPAPLEDPSGLRPDFIVAADGSGTHRTVQAALDAVPAAGREHHRIHILVRPGTYREALCVQGKAPFRLYGLGDPSAVVIVEGRYNGLVRPMPSTATAADRQAASEHVSRVALPEGCQIPLAPRGGAAASSSAASSSVTGTGAAAPPPTYGTPGSASVTLLTDDVQLQRLTIANDAMEGVRAGVGYPEGANERGGAQAVALLTKGDRIQLEDVRLIGHQDTFEAERVNGRSGRVLVRRSDIRGDVDFIFGGATLVIDNSLIVSRAGRRQPGHGGHVIAPSTTQDERYGILIQRSRWLAEPGVAPASISLGRAWDRGVPPGTWQPGAAVPNGQALLRDNLLGPHLAPWSASTSRRPFSTEGTAANRMAEFRNQALPVAAYEGLPEGDGWASVDGGTKGGAGAAPDAVRWVRTRAELDAALALGNTPKIIALAGRIDLAADAAGRRLGMEAFQDPAFDLNAFAKAYDPATWGRGAPRGALEDARQRSARRQAAQVVVRIPSHTTVIGITPDAGFDGGSLMMERVQQVILRNLRFSDAYDYFPAWDPMDNGHGEWNSEYDTVSLRDAQHVWVDHCSFDDGQRPDRAEPTFLGRPLQRHDGLLDITRQSDLVTVSWNVFRQHDKTMLIGGSDKHRDDRGRLRVTLHHNLWEAVKERTPRVRFGQVHVANNLFSVRADQPEGYAYSLGVGFEAQLLSEANAWELPADVPPRQVVRFLKGQRFEDHGSLVNAQPVDLGAAIQAAGTGSSGAGSTGITGSTGTPSALSGPTVLPAGWTPPYAWRPAPASDVASRVRQGAGAGRLW